MEERIDRIRNLIARLLAGSTEGQRVFLAIVAVVIGLALGVASVVPDIELASSMSITGTLTPLSESNGSFNAAGGFAEVRLVTGSCSVYVTLLNEAQLADFQATGNRPAPHLDCDRRVATFQYALRWIILENHGPTDEAYEVGVQSFSIRSPRALLAIPALPLVLGGTLFLALHGLRRGMKKLERTLRVEREKR